MNYAHGFISIATTNMLQYQHLNTDGGGQHGWHHNLVILRPLKWDPACSSLFSYEAAVFFSCVCPGCCPCRKPRGLLPPMLAFSRAAWIIISPASAAAPAFASLGTVVAPALALGLPCRCSVYTLAAAILIDPIFANSLPLPALLHLPLPPLALSLPLPLPLACPAAALFLPLLLPFS